VGNELLNKLEDHQLTETGHSSHGQQEQQQEVLEGRGRVHEKGWGRCRRRQKEG
jgi:hypothetical protein